MIDGKPELSSELRASLSNLRDGREAHLELLEGVWKADDGKLFPTDFYLQAVINRSLALIDGFVLLVESRNHICAAALLRLQLDNALRFYGTALADPEALARALRDERPWSRVRTRDGKAKLTDRFLVEELTKHFPFVERVYQRTSGFVHLSKSHLVAGRRAVDETTRTVKFEVSLDGPKAWPEELLIEDVEAFTAATKIVLKLGVDWLAQKDNVGGR